MDRTTWTGVKADNKYTPQPEFADSRELNNLVQRGIPPTPKPITSLENQSVPERHFNQYGVVLTPQDHELVDVVEIAIKNGWKWQEIVHESIIKGTEAESVVKTMKKTKANVRDLLLDIDFARALFGDKYKEELQSLVLQRDIMKYIKDKLHA